MSYFILLEGIDGCGKTTQTSLLKSYFEQQGKTVCLTREPGSTKIGQDIRKILESHNNINPTCELLLFLADRAQHVSEVLTPALKKYDIVISDRGLVSTLVYQGLKFQTDLLMMIQSKLKLLYSIDYCIILDVTLDTVKKRLQRMDGIENRHLDQFENIRQRYLEISKILPNCFVVDGNKDSMSVFNDIIEVIRL